jgi:uncharacterized phiE125 gp8 family phage protein
MRYRIIQRPNTLPVSLGDLRTYIRITDASVTLEDWMLTQLIGAATAYAERYTKRAIMTQTVRVDYDRAEIRQYAGMMWLPFGTVQGVDAAYTVDEDGVEVPITSPADYILRPSDDVSRVWIKNPGSYETSFVYRAGYGVDGTLVPPQIAQAVTQICATQYALRQDAFAEITVSGEALYSAHKLLDPYRVWL